MITLKNVSKIYHGGVYALQGINLEVEQRSFTVILGRSGAGKSTLLRCINGLVSPTDGEILMNNISVNGSKRNLKEVRQQAGMIFQQFNLVGRLSVLLNALTGRLSYIPTWRSLVYHFSKSEIELAGRALERVGLEGKAGQRADTLSGGEQQRLAIARVLVQQPKVILADEPVASLDPKTADGIMGLLKTINVEEGITVLCNLHQVEFARGYAEKVIGIRRGKVVFEDEIANLNKDTIRDIYDYAA